MRSICLLFVALALPLHADVSIAPIFGDHAVLQRDQPVKIWGRAETKEKIAVTFAGQTHSTVADAQGHWVVTLSPLPASSLGSDLLIQGKTSLTFHDVMVGDVWLCAGRSNMEFTVDHALNSGAETAATEHPLIRQFKVKFTASDHPADTVEGSWEVCSPAAVAHFTAIGYFFARDLQPRLNVPIGLINSSGGETQIELWEPKSVWADPAFTNVEKNAERVQKEFPLKHAAYEQSVMAWKTAQAAAKAKNVKFTAPAPREPWPDGPVLAPSSLFQGMIFPLAPYRLRGVLWYQGESNAYDVRGYAALFPALITSWRQAFDQADLPFYWVQLPNFRYNNDPFGTAWAGLREAQSRALALPETAQAITIDIGEPFDLHPHNKQEVGRRLALLARSKLFGAFADSSGPLFVAAQPEGAQIRVHFDHAGTGLTAHDRPLQSFQIAGADRRFFPATAKISGETVLVSAPQVPVPVAVRYAWFNAPEANLFNGAGLPAAPFRSDSW